MKETFHSVIEFPDEWPVSSDIEYQKFRHSKRGFELAIIFLTNGSIFLEINYPDKHISFKSQKIEFLNANRGVLTAIWDDDISLLINGEKIDDSSNNNSFKVESKPLLEIPMPDLSSEEVIEKCSEWTEWRKNKFINKKKDPKKNRRLATLEEQLNNLDIAIDDLSKALYSKSHITPDDLQLILPILRSLIFWTDGKQSKFNPLLFRLASKLDLPLPVYALRNESNLKEYNPHLILKNNIATQIKKYPAQDIMDFQEWLNSEIMIEGYDSSFTLKDIVIEGASTKGYGHFDEDIPLFLDVLDENKVGNNPIILGFVGNIAETTILYGKEIISRLKN